MNLREITEEQIWIIQLLSNQTWPRTFAEILSEEQIGYMMNMMYSDESLKKQLSEGHHYLVVEDGGEYVGYLSYELSYKGTLITKVHKIYVLPLTQGSGVGRFLISSTEAIAKGHNQTHLSLNVNRFNKAVQFYERMGFVVTGEEDIDIGDGFLMEDYIMTKTL